MSTFINEAKNLYICYATDIQKSILISKISEWRMGMIK